ncbi:Rossmann-like and DUF2520 domain-containing protein [Acinetobacter shaoyimingii]|uniref:DUF2520 domain-containing protein n=1 Tax=Acinetobacter shaoyimingii TaxID=2715164 RepID=A0A6G8RWQ7_9GAMM|nr:Rossmann-like and DUF2520 domain-containing protein [Acinetobacter shaoyimingii]QIO06305.1 DUF2520 domain-containing protein [Acinetobacter shaoyimingii]
MRISLVGAGRVATHLAKALHQDHEIVDIYSRSIEYAEQLAQRVSARACDQFSQMQQHIDVLVIAVSDQAINTVIQGIAEYFDDVLIAHTSGSTHIHILEQYHTRCGVLYPLQTFSLERDIDWKTTPLLIEASQDADLSLLTNIANQLSQRVYHYDSAQRLSLHLSAVFACNFTNYCYDMAKQVVDARDVDFSLLYPLMIETAHKATQHAPQTVQTGPAVRKDQNIINMHEKMLKELHRDDLKKIYHDLSDAIMNRI